MIKQENCRKTSASLTMLKPFVDHNKICGKFLELGIPEHLTCLLRNLYAHQEAKLELGMEQLICTKLCTNFVQILYKLGKEYNIAVYCHPAYLTSMQSTSCEMPG